MKSVFNFKQLLIAMATVVMALNLSSCKDQNFDWDAYHANSAQEKFTDVFVKTYGKPAENHDWGFDMEWSKPTTTETRADKTYTWDVTKFDSYSDNIDIFKKYGTVPNITAHEHRDVLEWFSKHKVIWQNTTARSEKPGTPVSMDDCVYFDGTNSTRVLGGNGMAYQFEALSNDNTIIGRVPSEYTTNGQYCEIGITMNFEYAWVQHVASDPHAFDAYANKDERSNDVGSDGDFKHRAGGCDYLVFYDSDGEAQHVNDFNLGAGDYDSNGEPINGFANNGDNHAWGWGRQHQDYTANDPYNGNAPTYWGKKNGVFIGNADFNNTSYGSSEGSSLPHDKWILVYLKGDDFEGYYLGFDLESAGTTADEQIPADGICNDWIIKVSAVNRTVDNYPVNCRIMCEDLGGFQNVAPITDAESMTSDIDYNDVVFDISTSTIDQRMVLLTLHAAGGVLPLTIWYDGALLFETHEMFYGGVVRKQPYILSGAYNDQGDTPTNMGSTEYNIMYNTEGETVTTTDGVSSRSIGLLFQVQNKYFDGIKNVIFYDSDKFDIKKLDIKVWRHSSEDYLEQSTGLTYSPAEWLLITNYSGEAPLKICVPQSVRWAKERKEIHSAYESFKDWVKDPSKEFWTGTGRVINENQLCTQRTITFPAIIVKN